jgi:hypothetical protein
MSELVSLLAPLDEIELAREVERLFALQDRHLTEDKKSILIRELAASGVTFRELVTGIRKLSTSDMKSIRVSDIITASREGGSIEAPDGCAMCFKSGFVSMANKDGYSFVYACNCELGSWYAKNQNLTKWNGKRRMLSKKYGVVTLGLCWSEMAIPDATEGELSGSYRRDPQPAHATAYGNQTEQETVQWEP